MLEYIVVLLSLEVSFSLCVLIFFPAFFAFSLCHNDILTYFVRPD